MRDFELRLRVNDALQDRWGQNYMYRRYVKRVIDVALSLAGLLLASWLYLIIMIAIKIDDPGPVFFTQKRVGIHKKYFRLYKFRSMKMSTPHDMPTHLLEDPGVYITRVGDSCAEHRWMRSPSSGTFCGAI